MKYCWASGWKKSLGRPFMLILILLADRIEVLVLRGRVLLRWCERTSGFCIIRVIKIIAAFTIYTHLNISVSGTGRARQEARRAGGHDKKG